MFIGISSSAIHLKRTIVTEYRMTIVHGDDDVQMKISLNSVKNHLSQTNFADGLNICPAEKKTL